MSLEQQLDFFFVVTTTLSLLNWEIVAFMFIVVIKFLTYFAIAYRFLFDSSTRRMISRWSFLLCFFIILLFLSQICKYFVQLHIVESLVYIRRLRLVSRTNFLHFFDQNFFDLSYIFAHDVKFFIVFLMFFHSDSIYSFIRYRSLFAFDSDFDKFVSRYCSNFSRFINFQSRWEYRIDFSTKHNFTHVSIDK